jgi:hypothetical protein
MHEQESVLGSSWWHPSPSVQASLVPKGRPNPTWWVTHYFNLYCGEPSHLRVVVVKRRDDRQ